MTLILGFADRTMAALAVDTRHSSIPLTATGEIQPGWRKHIRTSDMHRKMVLYLGPDAIGQLAYTGPVMLGSSRSPRDTIEFLARAISNQQPGTMLSDVLTEVARVVDGTIAGLRPPMPLLVVWSGCVGGSERPVVATISTDPSMFLISIDRRGDLASEAPPPIVFSGAMTHLRVFSPLRPVFFAQGDISALSKAVRQKAAVRLFSAQRHGTLTMSVARAELAQTLFHSASVMSPSTVSHQCWTGACTVGNSHAEYDAHLNGLKTASLRNPDTVAPGFHAQGYTDESDGSLTPVEEAALERLSQGLSIDVVDASVRAFVLHSQVIQRLVAVVREIGVSVEDRGMPVGEHVTAILGELGLRNSGTLTDALDRRASWLEVFVLKYYPALAVRFDSIVVKPEPRESLDGISTSSVGVMNTCVQALFRDSPTIRNRLAGNRTLEVVMTVAAEVDRAADSAGDV